MKKYFENFWKNIVKFVDKIFWIFWKFWKKYLDKWVLRGIECSRHRHLKSHSKRHLKTYLKSELKSQLEIHSKSHGNISHIVCELKESENQPSTSFKKLWVVGGGWVHLDYNVSSWPWFGQKPIVRYVKVWLGSMPGQGAWQYVSMDC